tara:strand:+ start:49 stop:771 length:723 start_codon:yes stop_codon:yes gene_type:complete
MEYKKISEIKLLENNPRTISDRQFKILCTSIKKNIDYFEARPLILSDRTGELVVIAGNQRYKAAEHLGLKEVPTYLMKNLTEETEREIVIRDNISNGDWDFDLLANEWDTEELEEWGLDIPNINLADEEYTTKIESPIYETKEVKPLEIDLYNLQNYNKLIEDIDKSDITEDEKKFLYLAAGRHIEFSYSKIADYYAHSNEAVQSLMEDSALIIIDYKKAIDRGFVKLYETLETLADIDG